MVNQGDGSFVEAAAAYGLDSLADGRGLGISDFDGDGDLDLAVNNYVAPAQLFVNQVADGHWLQVRLRGRHSNRDGIGAILRLEAGGHQQMRVITAGDGYASQFSKSAHFGLGDAEIIDRLEIHWPRGQKQVFLDVPVDGFFEADESSSELRLLRVAEESVRLPRAAPAGTVCVTPPEPAEGVNSEAAP